MSNPNDHNDEDGGNDHLIPLWKASITLEGFYRAPTYDEAVRMLLNEFPTRQIHPPSIEFSFPYQPSTDEIVIDGVRYTFEQVEMYVRYAIDRQNKEMFGE